LGIAEASGATAVETTPFAAVLLSALLHAAWNAITRAAPERGDVLASGVVVSGMIGVPALMIVALPDPASWAWPTTGVIINTIGIRLAMAAYRSASYGLAYPAMRAGIPLLTLPITALLLAEWPAPAGVAGVLLIAAALIMLAAAARQAGPGETKGLGYGLLAALAGAGSMPSDAIGVRLSGNVLGYAFMVAVGNGIAITLLSAMEGRNLLAALPARSRRAAVISLI
jgi:hypothetical protein